MKTSNIVLTATGLLTLAVLLLANMNLKAEFEKGAYKSRFYKLESRPVAAAKNISISVPGYLRVCLEKAATNELKYRGGWDEYIEVSTRGDSLKVHVKENLPHGADTLYILLKDLSAVGMTDRGRLKISRFGQARLDVRAEGNSYIEFQNTAIDSLAITGRDNSVLLTGENNKIGFLNLLLEDKAVFQAAGLEFSGLKTRIGPQSKVELTGSSLTSFMEH